MAKKVASKKPVEAEPKPEGELDPTTEKPAKVTRKTASKPASKSARKPRAAPGEEPPPAAASGPPEPALPEPAPTPLVPSEDPERAELRATLDAAQAELRRLRAASETSKIDKEWQEQANTSEVIQATVARASAERRATDLQQQLDAAIVDLEARRNEVEAARTETAELRKALESARERGRCPKCGERMVKAELGGVKIDRCRGCDAVCVDAVEIERWRPRAPDRTTLTDVTLGAAPTGTTLPEGEKPGFWKGLFRRKSKED